MGVRPKDHRPPRRTTVQRIVLPEDNRPKNCLPEDNRLKAEEDGQLSAEVDNRPPKGEETTAIYQIGIPVKDNRFKDKDNRVNNNRVKDNQGQEQPPKKRVVNGRRTAESQPWNSLDPPKVNDGTFGGQRTKDHRTTSTEGTTKKAHDGALRPNTRSRNCCCDDCSEIVQNSRGMDEWSGRMVNFWLTIVKLSLHQSHFELN